MGDDPYRPQQYVPGPDPDSDLPDVGSGPQFGADLFRLYRAGAQLLPHAAEVLAEATTVLDDCRAAMPSSGYAAGSPSVFEMITALEVVQGAIARTSTNTDLAGQALIEIADRYVRTDAEAAARFNDLTVKRLLPVRVADAARPERPAPLCVLPDVATVTEVSD